MQSCRRNKFVAAFTRDPYSSLASWRERRAEGTRERVERLMHFHFAGDGNGDRQVEVLDDIRMQSAPGVRHKGAGRNDGMGWEGKSAEAAGARRTWNFKSSFSFLRCSGFFKIPPLRLLFFFQFTGG